MKLSTFMIGAALALPIPAFAQAGGGAIVLAQAGAAAELQVEAARQRLAEAQAALEAAQASGEGVEAAEADVAAAQQELAAAQAAAAESQVQEEPQPGAADPAPAEEPAPAETQEQPAAEEPSPAPEQTQESAPGAAEAPAAEEQQSEPAETQETQPEAGKAEAPAEQKAEETQPETAPAEQTQPKVQQQSTEEPQPGAVAPASSETEQPALPPAQESQAAPGATSEPAQPQASAAPEQLGVKGEAPDPQVQGLREKLGRERRQAGQSDPGNGALRTGASSAAGVAAGAAAGVIAGQVIQSFGDRVVIERDGQRYIRSDSETDRLLRRARDVDVEDLGEGRTRTVVWRENGAQIITIRDYDGQIIRRTRVGPDGREVVMIDDRWAGPRDRGRFERFERDMPPVRYDMPRERYIVDMGRASERDLEEALAAPPVEEVERAYTLDEIRDSSRLRDKLRRIDLDAVTFDTGSAAISRSEIAELALIGRAMEDLIARNPGELFLVEGHTDAVGPDLANLALSDRRAESVAIVLSENFDIPPENLVTQGYGEQYLKVPSEGAERQNRRVTVRRITPLLQGEARR